jgi:hypothetical protein
MGERRWDADKQILFDWSNTCPKQWTPHWYESEAGNVTLHLIRSSIKLTEREEEILSESKLLNIARGRSYLND